MSVNQLDLSIELAAAAADLSERHLRRLCKAGDGPPQSPDGRFPAREFGAWQRAREKAKYITGPGGIRLDPVAERARLNQAQADHAELQLAELRGKSVLAEHVLEFWAGMVAAVRAKLLALPAKIAQRVAPPGRIAEVEALVRELVYEALTELAGSGLPPETVARQERAKRAKGGK